MSFVIISFSLALLAGGIGILLNKKGKESRFRSFSITIVARNEEKVLPQTLDALSKIDYPEDLYEIILVDDCSSDQSEKIFRDFASAREGVKVLKIEEESKSLPGKKEGLQKALEKARYEIFLLTDADCIVEPRWLHDCSRYWDDKTLMIVGYAPEDYSKLLPDASVTRKLCFYFRRFTQLVSSGVFAATIGLGIPFSCYGRNLGIARQTFLQEGGYNKTGLEKSGDDKQALNLMKKLPGKIRYSPVKNVITFPELESYTEQQKRRFGKLKMSSPLHFIFTILVIGFFLYLPFRLVISGDYRSFLIFYLAAFAVWVINLAKHKEAFLIYDLIYLVIYPYYMIYFTIKGLKGDWQWKS